MGLEPEGESSPGGTENPGTTGGGLPPAGSSSTSVDEVGSSTSSGGQTEGSDSSTTGCVVDGPAVPPDPENPDSRCLGSDLEDACGCGYRCTLYKEDDESFESPWRHSGCFPVDPAPVALGDACVHEDFSWSGRDNCPAGSMCEDFDRDGQGVCREFCSRDFDYECAEPDAVPWVGCQDCGCVCQVSCSPLEDECGDGQACYLGYGLGLCAPTPLEAGGLGDPCEYTNACDGGLACVDSTFVAGCDTAAGGCCTPFCDVASPDCPAGTECSEIWDPGEAEAPILEGLGYCLVPES